MPRSIWNGVISFGMVSIPVKMYSATESKDIAFHQVHKKCESRIKYQKYCPTDEEVVDNDEIVKGYEFAKGQYVILDEEDFDQLPLASKHTVEVSAFVKMEQIDPIYFEKSYYMEADEAATRPFVLFMRALTDMEMVAIATVTLRNKERLCALRAMGGTLILDTLLYPDEIRVSADDPLPSVKINEKELQMAEHLIELMQTDFDPDQYKDHYRQALKKVIDAKLEGKEIVMPKESPKAKVVDLMEALRASVENLKSGKGAAEGTEDQVEDIESKPSRRKSHSKSEEEKPARKRSTAAKSTSRTRKKKSA
jgi:DNA end-binding protein Ku